MNIYKKYASIRAKIKLLEEAQKELEDAICKEVSALSAPMKTEYGTFTTYVRVSWTYSPAVSGIKNKLSQVMKDEQKTGLARKTESTSLRFTGSSNNFGKAVI